MNPIVVIAASTGGLEPLREIVAALPPTFKGSAFIVWHTGRYFSWLPTRLSRPDGLPVSFGKDGAAIEPGHIYVAPPDHHMLLEPDKIRLDRGPKVNFTRPAANPLFLSAAKAYGNRVTGIVLSGEDGDGATGLRFIKIAGGTALVQHPVEAEAPSMPLSAMAADTPEVLTVERICERLRRL